jgi:hypothetical protein
MHYNAKILFGDRRNSHVENSCMPCDLNIPYIISKYSSKNEQFLMFNVSDDTACISQIASERHAPMNGEMPMKIRLD